MTKFLDQLSSKCLLEINKARFRNVLLLCRFIPLWVVSFSLSGLILAPKLDWDLDLLPVSEDLNLSLRVGRKVVHAYQRFL